MKVITSRRICWPTPDGVCLEGGCLYCNDNPFIPISWIRNYAARNGLIADFARGAEMNFNNAELKWKEVER